LYTHQFQQLERRDPAELAGNNEDTDDLEEDEEEDSVDDENHISLDEDDVEDDDDARVQELRGKIEDTLKVNGIEATTGNLDEDSDEELMDDGQMMAIDEQLSQVFRSRVNEKKSYKGC
jgi:DNA polymerase phi